MDTWRQSDGCECREVGPLEGAGFYTEGTGKPWQSLEQHMANTMAFGPSALGQAGGPADRQIPRADAATHVSREAPRPTCSHIPLNAPGHLTPPSRLIGRGAWRLRGCAVTRPGRPRPGPAPSRRRRR